MNDIMNDINDKWSFPLQQSWYRTALLKHSLTTYSLSNTLLVVSDLRHLFQVKSFNVDPAYSNSVCQYYCYKSHNNRETVIVSAQLISLITGQSIFSHALVNMLPNSTQFCFGTATFRDSYYTMMMPGFSVFSKPLAKTLIH